MKFRIKIQMRKNKDDFQDIPHSISFEANFSRPVKCRDFFQRLDNPPFFFLEFLPTRTHRTLGEHKWEDSSSWKSLKEIKEPVFFLHFLDDSSEWRAQRLLYSRMDFMGPGEFGGCTKFKAIQGASVSLEIKLRVFNPGWPGQNV